MVTHLNEYFSFVFAKEDLINIPQRVPVHSHLGNGRSFELKFDVSYVANA